MRVLKLPRKNWWKYMKTMLEYFDHSAWKHNNSLIEKWRHLTLQLWEYSRISTPSRKLMNSTDFCDLCMARIFTSRENFMDITSPRSSILNINRLQATYRTKTHTTIPQTPEILPPSFLSHDQMKIMVLEHWYWIMSTYFRAKLQSWLWKIKVMIVKIYVPQATG